MATVQISPGSATVVLNAAGAGTVKVGPVGARETWNPAGTSVSASSNNAEAQCKIYAGTTPTAENYIDGTLSGSTGDSSGRIGGVTLGLGSFVWAVWTGGDPGAVATLNVTGTRDV